MIVAGEVLEVVVEVECHVAEVAETRPDSESSGRARIACENGRGCDEGARTDRDYSHSSFYNRRDQTDTKFPLIVVDDYVSDGGSSEGS